MDNSNFILDLLFLIGQFLIYIPICYLITVIFHELSHMFVALLVGVKVERFSVGFGKILYTKKIKGINFCISAIPLGGYVKMEGEDEPTNLGWLEKRYIKKLAILLAGVTANLIIALICYLLNYHSIKIGIYVDWMILKATFTKQSELLAMIMYTFKPNLFLLQLSLLNSVCFLTNLMPIPALDGGYIWVLWLEKIFKEKFPVFLKIINTVFFILLLLVQVVLMIYILML